MRSEELLGPLFEQVPVGLLAVRPDGTVLLANQWMLEFFEPFTVDPDSRLMRVDWRRISLPDGRPVPPGTLPPERCLLERRQVGRQEYLYHGIAGDRSISIDAVPVLDADGTIIAYASTIVDETTNRRFLDQLGEIQRELDTHVRELNRVHRLIERLSSRSELHELLAETAEVVAELDGADLVGIFLEHGGELRMAASCGMSAEQIRIVNEVESKDLYTSRRSLLGLPTTLVDVHTEPGLPPAYRKALRALGAESVYSIPLPSADGTVLGSVVSVFRSVRMPSPHQRQLVETCGRIVAQLIINARVRARDRDVAVALQRSMMQSRLPEVGWGELATYYRAGSTGMYVGGDWFHAARLTDGRLSLVIGDVVGHGIDAVGTMGRMRSAVRAYTLPAEGTAPPGPLELATLLDHWCVATDYGLTSTACFADIRPDTRRCTLASAGHLPPLVVDPRAIPRFTHTDALGAPLGLLSEGAQPTEISFHLPPGATLLLYTDGLVERRGEDLTDGLARLAEVAMRELRNAETDGGDDLAAACARIAQACAPESATADDVAMMAFRMRR
ncbi:SpoIIE family protein phosphatase [Actinospica sp.]|uniref:SpoIIE family protein phosphatase n=1 Tax=Actinospica sp. TaxID=1872142 RepID=UPI002B816AC6|nr:SpoIIE family protein phosphatase [Actinospica sp.]HWG22571.1 SpoIIE family protein phosphatase [Actinospica sp.]